MTSHTWNALIGDLKEVASLVASINSHWLNTHCAIRLSHASFINELLCAFSWVSETVTSLHLEWTVGQLVIWEDAVGEGLQQDHLVRVTGNVQIL